MGNLLPVFIVCSHVHHGWFCVVTESQIHPSPILSRKQKKLSNEANNLVHLSSSKEPDIDIVHTNNGM